MNIEYQVMNAPYCSEGSIPLLVSLELKEKVCNENIIIHEFELYFYSSILVSITIYLLISIADMHWDIHAINTKQ